MSVKRGQIHLVDFGKKYQSELGKIRPALVLQSDYVNNNLDVAAHKSVLVVPMTTDRRGGRFRLKIGVRDRLEKESELIINWMCTVDLKRVVSKEPLTHLTEAELLDLRLKLDFFMGYFD